MRGGSLRYFIGFMVTILLVIVLIIILVTGGNSSKVPNTSRTLGSYASTPNTEVRLTIDGPVNANQAHQEIQITVNNADVTYSQIQTYQGTSVNTQSYANSQAAYGTFLQALQHAGYTEGSTNPKLSDERGYCPLGNRYVYELIQNGKDVERFWSTSCGNPHTYEGDAGLTVELFESQVPNFSDLTENLNISL